MINSVTANDLKTKGVSILEEITSNEGEAIITVRGKDKYVVLTMNEYNYLRECELEAALIEAKKDMQNGNFNTDSIDNHINRISDV